MLQEQMLNPVSAWAFFYLLCGCLSATGSWILLFAPASMNRSCLACNHHHTCHTAAELLFLLMHASDVHGMYASYHALLDAPQDQQHAWSSAAELLD